MSTSKIFQRVFNSVFSKKFMQNNVISHKHGFIPISTLSTQFNNLGWFKKSVIILGGFSVGGGLYGYLTSPTSQAHAIPKYSEKQNYTLNDRIPENVKISREVSGPASNLGLDLTLYQYQTCPFCCKVRAFLDFYGIPYRIVEVNPVMRQQLKFSEYKKVPILIAQEKDTLKHQLNDSTAIISILGTLLTNMDKGLKSVLPLFTPVSFTDDNGKKVEEVLNKYFIMYGDKFPQENIDKILEKERKWRKWADTEFVHILSPNIYRTYDEALNSFKYFSEAGEWEKNFSTLERKVVIYVGATAMYFVGKKLKKKYSLKDNVRESLYDYSRLWIKEIGHHKKFMGGNVPNLADLAVYGLLSSIEGCLAFKDLLENTNIGPWYFNMKEAVVNHHGYQTVNL